MCVSRHARYDPNVLALGELENSVFTINGRVPTYIHVWVQRPAFRVRLAVIRDESHPMNRY